MSKHDCLNLINGDMQMSDRLEDLDDWGDLDPQYIKDIEEGFREEKME